MTTGLFTSLPGLAVQPAKTDPNPLVIYHGKCPDGFGAALAAWLYFVLLERTDNYEDKPLHWLILIGGFFLLIASRLYIDIRVYGISF